jgi:flagellar protein FlaF
MMGFSTSAATAILFTGVIVLMGVTANVVFNMYEDLSRSALEVSDAEFDRQRTRLSVVNSSFNSTKVFINVTNTGEVIIDTSQLDLLIDGVIETDSISMRQVSGTSSGIWGVHEVLYLEVDYASAGAGTRIRLITPNGVSGSALIT